MLGHKTIVAFLGFALVSQVHAAAVNTFPQLDMLDAYLISTTSRVQDGLLRAQSLSAEASALLGSISSDISGFNIAPCSTAVASTEHMLADACFDELEVHKRSVALLQRSKFHDDMTEISRDIGSLEESFGAFAAQIEGLDDRHINIQNNFADKRDTQLLKFDDKKGTLARLTDTVAAYDSSRACELLSMNFNLTETTAMTVTPVNTYVSPTVYCTMQGIISTIDENKPAYGNAGYGYALQYPLHEVSGFEIMRCDFDGSDVIVKVRDLSRSKDGLDRIATLSVEARVCGLTHEDGTIAR